MPFETIQLTIEESGIARLLLDRPEQRNAMTSAMGHEVAEAVRQIDQDDGVRVVIIRGAGKAFCSGADLGDLAHEAGIAEDREGCRQPDSAGSSSSR